MAQAASRQPEPGVGRFQATIPWFGTRVGFFVTLGLRRTITSYQIAGVENTSAGTVSAGDQTVQSAAPGTVGPGRLPPPPPPPMVHQVHSALVFEAGLMRERSGGSPGTTGPQDLPPPPPAPPP